MLYKHSSLEKEWFKEFIKSHDIHAQVNMYLNF